MFTSFSLRSGGHPWLFGLLNCFVHILMYAYYFGSVYYEELKKMIWIKRILTKIQIVRFPFSFKCWNNFYHAFCVCLLFFQIQFILSITHLCIPLFYGDCNYPKGLLIMGITQNTIMLVLFSDFYFKAYVTRGNKAKLN